MKSSTKDELASSATASSPPPPTPSLFIGAPSKKKAGGTFKRRRNLLQSAGANPIGAFFIFLNLLERQPQGLAEFLLTHAEKDSAHTDPAADMAVDRIRDLLHETTLSSVDVVKINTLRR